MIGHFDITLSFNEVIRFFRVPWQQSQATTLYAYVTLDRGSGHKLRHVIQYYNCQHLACSGVPRRTLSNC